jgi:thioester reductase-like protein
VTGSDGSSLLVTGFPGFLATALLPRLLAGDTTARAVCLVQRRHAERARRTVDELDAPGMRLRDRVRLVEGDISRPGLGLDRSDLREVADVWHLAGVYDTTAPRELAERVNVLGTRHLLDTAGAMPRLRRFRHVSTCYVSGDHAGVFREEDLDVGQGFHSVYDETKFRAELEVRTAGAQGLPVTVYRPASVVGDSRTGWTQKYDGPYFLLRLLLRQRPALALVPRFTDPAKAYFNVVPVDFLTSALAALAGTEDGPGLTYQVADSRVVTVADIVVASAAATGRRVRWVPLPLGAVRRVAGAPGVRGLVGIPAPVFDYFASRTRYATANTQRALAGRGVTCPPWESYVGRLVAFMRAHPDVTSAAMV